MIVPGAAPLPSLRARSLLSLLLVGGCSGEASNAPADPAVAELTLAGTLTPHLERVLTSSPALPDSIFGRIVHLDLHETSLAVLDGLGSVVAVANHDLRILHVVGQRGEGPSEFVRPVASRVGPRRIVVMDPGRRRLVGFAIDGPHADSIARADGETVVDLRRSGAASLGTDFAIRQDGSVVVPVHEGPTFAAAVDRAGDLTALGPATGPEENHLMRLFDRVATMGADDLLVWDDDRATVMRVGDRETLRWRLPEPYRSASEPRQSVSPGGDALAITLGKPRLKGWAGTGHSICMVVEQDADAGADLLLLAFEGAADVAPTLWRIEADDMPGAPVSCGVDEDRLYVVDEIGAYRFRLP